MLIACRAVQGIGAGGLTALAPSSSPTSSPRASAAGTWASWAPSWASARSAARCSAASSPTALGWRWSFFVGVPFAVAAIIVLQRTLHLPARTRAQGEDRLRRRALLVGRHRDPAAVDHLRRRQFDWVSWQTAAMVGGSLLVLGRRDLGRVPRERADHPAAPVPEPHAGPRRRSPRSPSASRCSARGLPQPVHAAGARQDARPSPAC